MVSAENLQKLMEIEGAGWENMSEADQAKCMELVPQTQTPEYRAKDEDFFKAADVDGNGRLNRTEVNAYWDAQKKAWAEIGGPDDGSDSKELRDAWYNIANGIDAEDGITLEQFKAINAQQTEAFKAMMAGQQ